MKRVIIFTVAIITLLTFASLTHAEETGRYGYIDRDGNVVIVPQFDHAYSFLSYGPGLVYTGKLLDNGLPDDGLYGYIDKRSVYLDDFEKYDMDSVPRGIDMIINTVREDVLPSAVISRNCKIETIHLLEL